MLGLVEAAGAGAGVEGVEVLGAGELGAVVTG